MIEIRTKHPKGFARLRIKPKDKCPYCMSLFITNEVICCLSRGENNTDVPYSNFFADLNRALRSL